MEHVPSYSKMSWRDTLESLRSDEVVFDENPFAFGLPSGQEFAGADAVFFGKDQAAQLEDDFKFDWNELEEQKAKHVKFMIPDETRTEPEEETQNNVHVQDEGVDVNFNEAYSLDIDQSPQSETDSIERKLRHDFNNNYVNDIVLTINQLKFVRERLNSLITKVDAATVLQQTETAEPAFLTTEVENVKKSLISLLN
ncbi:hypothetical protein RNJ44_05095 [Nakaseomyces bracarensis]|uniref:Uncharacterized protein n=1 Tax=Nakaseomyces bracarensis TaxID=273131 RepID=A0ABR4NWS4_9SACH